MPDFKPLDDGLCRKRMRGEWERAHTDAGIEMKLGERRIKNGNGRGRRKGGRGTISVFLVLILVPCIVVSCLFGDISRVELSKAQASAAGDLSAYALMSHYDEELKEYYGLVASCQNIEDFYDTTATYFTGMMSANGVSDTGSGLFLSYLQSLQEGDITDFLQVEFTEAAAVTEADNSKLGSNAALIEDSIVEFMKYRGPYEIVNNILAQLQKKNVLSGVEGAEKDKPITEARQEYAEAESELLKDALYVYAAAKVYTDFFKANNVPSIEKYQEYADHLAKIAGDFERVTELITLYYTGTDGIQVVSFPLYSLNAYTESVKSKNVGTKVKTSSETIYCIDGDDLEELLEDIGTKCQEAETAAGNIASVCAGLGDPTTVDSDVNPALYCMKVQNTVSSSDLNTLSDRGDWLMYRYAELNAALSCSEFPEEESGDRTEKETEKEQVIESGGSLPENWKSQIRDAMSRIESAYNSCYKSGGNSAYLSFVSTYRKTAESGDGCMGTVVNVQERRYEFYSEYQGRNVRLGEFLEAVREEFGQIESDLNTQLDNINRIINGGTFTYNGTSYTSVSLDQLKAQAITCLSKRNSWGSTISSSGSTSDYAQSEQSAYDAEGEDVSEKFAAAITENNGQIISDFKTRLQNIKSDIQAFQTAVKNFKYGGSQVTTLSGREDAIAAGHTVIQAQSDLSMSNNKNAAAGYHASLLSPDAANVYQPPQLTTGETGNNPDLNTDCELYRLLTEQFGDRLQSVDDAVKKNEEENKKNQEKADKAKEGALEVDNYYLKGKGGNLSSSHGGSRVSATTAIGSIITVVNELLNGNGDELRDQLYVTEYLMDMFSYSSYNNEGQHRLAVENGKQYTLADFTEDGYPGYTELWAKEDKTKTPENQSLTNQPINSSHNQMNLGEIEYLLYGDKNLDENLKTSYKNIYAIREVLNLVSGFQNFFTGSSETAIAIETIADSIMAATAGVVPAALTKCILIGVLATLETSHDLIRLKAGVPVVLYKSTDDNWYYKISGTDAASFDEGGAEPVDENGIYYGDYLYLFLLLGTTNSSTYSSILLRAGDLIETNMQKMGVDGFDLDKSRCYFKISATLKVKPLLLDLPIVQSFSGADASTVTNASGWCTYKVTIIRGYS